MFMKNSFINQLRAKQASSQAPPQGKPVEQMSEEELDREEERLRVELRQLREEQVASATPARSRFVVNKRAKKRPWK
jgi:hypothetical protein